MSTAELTQLIDKKHEVLVQLCLLSRRQATMIDSSPEMNSLISLLAAKQQLISQLNQAERNLDPYRDEDPELRVWASPEHRRACAEKVRQCGIFLAEVMRLEKQGIDQLSQQRDETSKQLQSTSSGVQAHQAYTSAPSLPQSNFNLTSES